MEWALGCPGWQNRLRRRYFDRLKTRNAEPVYAFYSDIIEDTNFYKPAHFLSLEFVAYSNSDVVTTNEEIAEFAWVSLETAFTYPINTYTKRLLEWCVEHEFPRQV